MAPFTTGNRIEEMNAGITAKKLYKKKRLDPYLAPKKETLPEMYKVKESFDAYLENFSVYAVPFDRALPDLESGPASSIYDFSVETMEGKKKLSDYQTKVCLIVNVASKCGFTGHYKGLQELYDKYKDKGLMVLGFPCNQFWQQEPAEDSEIQSFCKTTYGVTFPVFKKIDVNGDKEHPLYKFLKGFEDGPFPDITWGPSVATKPTDIKWNFTKFLCVSGLPTKRYSFDVDPSTLGDAIEEGFALP
mmetsp:Transcript_88493/g.166859  ORF Transcript_88493/g.166859 Transcript_88493/m.166859 type:complete len:246 (+) Transcript_88493:85-822(+)